MQIVFLDAATLGDDLSFSEFEQIGDVRIYPGTTADEVRAHLKNAEIAVVNKVKMNAQTIEGLNDLRLICLAATGYDNVDLDYCREKGIAVCNVVGYSTQSVAQLTVSMALSLMTHLSEYVDFVRSGAYTESGIANRLIPVYHEIAGKTWGIVGYGNIGRQVGCVAEALGCRVLVHKRRPTEDSECVELDRICRESDILSLHTPLSDSTRGLLDRAHIAMLKPSAIVINVARGAVTDEAALAEAIREKRIAGLGVDVYSTEPFPKEHPFWAIKSLPNVLLTPHMAWGGYETRLRVLSEMAENMRAFLRGETRNRVD